ncbi:MAG: High-affinity heme uptake system protein IsdE precursor [Syntrophorhabdus sp. PtaU1.Bin058]|nr:MAG: High-affinity heme uptake system protein IsdE precursor [Syntrophorhabdus sp. PtaU1.Bin058]
MMDRGKTAHQKRHCILRCRCILRLFAVFLLMALACTTHSQGREITDMFGKKVPVPDRPQRVFSTSPPITYMLYAIDPSMLVGLNFPVREWEKRYLRKEMQALPVLGGWFGQGATPNLEMVLKVNPEIVIVSKHDSAMNDKVDNAMRMMPMPVVNVILDSIFDYSEAFRYLGRVLGRGARAEELAVYTRRTLSEATSLAGSVPVQKRVSVYYAEGVDGLSTECDSSQHAELIPLVGGHNVHHCKSGDLFGMDKISLEQIMLYNPEVILVMEGVFYGKVFSDPRWQRIKAVRNKRVYLIPNQPFNWFDRPPSFMRLLGVKWLANLLYPERYRIDIVKEVRAFFKLFLGVELTAEEAKRMMER